MKKIYVILALITCTTSPNVLLEKPKLLSTSEVNTRAANWETAFTWGLGMGCNFSCAYKDGKAGFLIQAYGIPVRSYNYSYYAALKDIISSYRQPQRQGGYYVAEPMKISGHTPTALSIDELNSYLHDKTFIFYTGAGMSTSGKVATMHDLQTSLKIDLNNRSLLKQPFLKEAFVNPQSLTDAFDAFCKSAIEGEPTLAHKAVHAIAQHENIVIVTENVDLLQQRAGSMPIMPHPGMCKSDDVKAVSVIVCVGLSHDDRGFLSYFKKHNPEGVIIAIDKGNPDYLSNNDYIVRKDLQVVLPAMAECICGKFNYKD